MPPANVMGLAAVAPKFTAEFGLMTTVPPPPEVAAFNRTVPALATRFPAKLFPTANVNVPVPFCVTLPLPLSALFTVTASLRL